VAFSGAAPARLRSTAALAVPIQAAGAELVKETLAQASLRKPRRPVAERMLSIQVRDVRPLEEVNEMERRHLFWQRGRQINADLVTHAGPRV